MKLRENVTSHVALTTFHHFTATPYAPLDLRCVKVVWYPTYAPKGLFKFVEKRSIVCYYAHEHKMNCEGFTQNGCYGNQPQPFEIGFYRVSANISCSFTKQDLTVY